MAVSFHRLRLPIAAALVALAATGLALAAGEPATMPRAATGPRVESVFAGPPHGPTKSKVETCSTEDIERAYKPGPINGVTLKIKTECSPPDEQDAIEVAWTLWYTGPRPPLVIRRPSLIESFPVAKETELSFTVRGRSGTEYKYSYSSPFWIHFAVSASPPEYFLRIPAAGSASGGFRVKVAEIRDTFLKHKSGSSIRHWN